MADDLFTGDITGVTRVIPCVTGVRFEVRRRGCVFPGLRSQL